jgi:hypothetical protein
MRLNSNKKIRDGSCAVLKVSPFCLWGHFCFIFRAIPIFILVIFNLGAAVRPMPKAFVKKLKNSHYQLIVEGKPYVIKGVCYNPIPIGQNHEYNWWGDPNKPWEIDGELMQKMGVNAIRVYQVQGEPEEVK